MFSAGSTSPCCASARTEASGSSGRTAAGSGSPTAARLATFGRGEGLVIVVALLGLLVLVLLYGAFTAAETSIVALRKTRLRDAGQRDSSGANAVRKLRDEPERLLATGRTVTLLAAAAAGATAATLVAPPIADAAVAHGTEPSLARIVAPLGTTSIVGALLVTMGDLVPRALALHAPERCALPLGRVLLPLAALFTPITRLLTGAANTLLRPFGVRTTFVESRLSAEELRQLVEEASRAGTIDPLASGIASRAIDFGRLTASDVMVPRNDVVSISVHASVDELQTVLLETGHSRLPVWDRNVDDVVGYISAKDVHALTFERQLFVIQDLMRPAYFVAEAMRAVTLLEELRRRCIHLALVTDEQGGLAGIVTIEDLVEELVGDIFSEHDADVSSPLQHEPDGGLIVSGTVPIRDVNRELALELPEGEHWSTVAGLCIAIAGRIPRAGERLEADDGTMLEVLDASPRRVRTVRVRHAAGGG